MRLHTLKELDSSEGTVQLHDHSGDGQLLFHPTPNPNDANDPLRWQTWKKHACFASICTFVFMTNYGIGGLAPAFYELSLEFHRTQTETSALLVWPILTLGAFNFFWVPMALYFGKRPIFVVASLLLSLGYLWGALSNSFESLLWSSIIAAFAGASTEALGASVRGNMMSVYMNAINGGNTIGPLICGFVVTGLSWRWHKWIAFILSTINWLCIVLFVPETRYDRTEFLSHQQQPHDSTAASSTPPTPPPEVDEAKEARIDAIEEPVESLPHGSLPSIPKKTWFQGLSMWSGTPKDKSLVALFLRPMLMVVYPAVAFATLAFAASLAWLVAINILNPFVLQAPPYSFAPDVDGLINIPGFLGNLAGAFLGGWVVDRYSDWCSRRAKGVFQPETRLHLIWIPTLIVSAGCLAFGYGAGEDLNWTALFFGNGMVSLGLTFVPVVTMTYVSDSYLPVNADALLLVCGLKNILTFGFLYAIIPWVSTSGYINSFGAQAGINVAVMMLAIPLIFYGKRIRHVTAQWRIII